MDLQDTRFAGGIVVLTYAARQPFQAIVSGG
jgi:hypothetical protein